MLKKKIYPVFALCLSALLLISVGCGKKKPVDETDSVIDTTEISSEEESPEEPASDIELNDKDVLDEIKNVPDGPRVEDAPVTEENKSEGLNVVPGTIVGLADNAIIADIGVVYDVPSENPALQFEMNDIALATPDEMTSDQEANRVVRVTYTYTNKTFDNLMIGQYSMKAVNDKGEALPIYYFNPEKDDEANMYPVAPGESCRAAVGFILGDADTRVTVIYDDNAGKSGTEITWTVDF